MFFYQDLYNILWDLVIFLNQFQIRKEEEDWGMKDVQCVIIQRGIIVLYAKYVNAKDLFLAVAWE